MGLPEFSVVFDWLGLCTEAQGSYAYCDDLAAADDSEIHAILADLLRLVRPIAAEMIPCQKSLALAAQHVIFHHISIRTPRARRSIFWPSACSFHYYPPTFYDKPTILPLELRCNSL